MKTFIDSLKKGFVITAFLTLILGIGYPLLICGIGKLFFHQETNGSLLYYKDGKVIGSDLIGQNFTKPHYFHPRPSAAGDKGYDAENSSGSNLGPTSKKLISALDNRIQSYRSENALSPNIKIPADAVTSSGSGLDPHISVDNALLQAPRIATARKLPLATVKKLIEDSIDKPSWGFLGEDRINVLRINLELDNLNTKNKINLNSIHEDS
jgi:K+-transporting ATPase ATPase C chain